MSEDARLRQFAMSNLMVENALDHVEEEFELVLRPRRRQSDIEDKYYPQFDEKVRHEAKSMARHYEIFYCLERSMRQLVASKFSDAHGGDWWSKEGIVPVQIQTGVSDRMQREMDSAVTMRSTDPLEYTTFGELGQLVIANWALFGDMFNSRKAVEKVMANLNTIRGPIAHCSPLAADEILRLELSVRDWYRLME